MEIPPGDAYWKEYRVHAVYDVPMTASLVCASWQSTVEKREQCSSASAESLHGERKILSVLYYERRKVVWLDWCKARRTPHMHFVRGMGERI
jgi:hypothetical protein